MKIEIKEIKTIDNREVVRITSVDERWYIEGIGKDKKFYPSFTWVFSYYPKGIRYFKWLASKGWDESQALMHEAGEKGTKVHRAIEDLSNGKEVKMSDKYFNEMKDCEEELTVEEWEAIMSFVDWFNLVKPENIANEFTVINEEMNCAGTVDKLCLVRKDIKVGTMNIPKGFWLIDYKTSNDIWPSHELQVNGYKHSISDNLKKKMWKMLSKEERFDKEFKDIKMAILQVGYKKNKNGFKFTQIKDKYDLCKSVKDIWVNECADVEPKQIDYPKSLKL
jgi:hypothetical protein